MPRRGENIYKRKDGRWEGRYVQSYKPDGKPKYGYVYAKTYSDVRQRLAERKSGGLPRAVVVPPVKYSEALRSWLQTARINIKESSYSKYSQMIDTHISPVLGDYPIHLISTQVIELFIQNQLSNGRLDGKGGLSSKTVTDMLTIIKGSMRHAQERGMTISCNLHKVTIKRKDKKMRVFSPEEQELLVKELTTGIDRYKFGVILALYTGIRLDELCALQWEDLSLPSAVLKVRKTLQRIQDKNHGATAKTKVVITEPKSRAAIRDIPLPQFLVELARQFEGSSKEYILSGNKAKYVEPRIMQNRFKGYIRDSGIDDANFHTTRHTFATRCVELGFDIKTLSEILGHANVNITLDRYVHSSFELKRSNMNKLSLP